MAKEYICNSDKYFYSYQTIALPVSFSDLPKEFSIEGHKLFIKSSFHVSLVCIGKITEKYDVNIPDFEKKIIDDFCEFAATNNISLTGYTGEFKFVSQNDRRTIVAMCHVQNLQNFFNLINKKYNLNVEAPPTHVTLYTLQPDLGIFLTDKAEMDELTRIVPKVCDLPWSKIK